jgi:hypothetical protein
MAVANNFDSAHRFFSQALVALANPYSSAFTDVRNSSIASVMALRELSAGKAGAEFAQCRADLSAAGDLLRRLNVSVPQISACRLAIQGLLNAARPAAAEPHAEIFANAAGADKDSSKDE